MSIRQLAFLSMVALVAACGGARSGAGGSPGTITEADIQNSNEPIERIIQKRVPGVVVTRSNDGSIALQIRGNTTLSGDVNPPLYVLNGLPFKPGPGGSLTGIDPYSISSIKVLRGAEAGIYGIDGANGVIVITTRR